MLKLFDYLYGCQIKFFIMEIWQIWILVALVFVIVEFFTSGFAVACFSVGALASAVVALCGGSLLWQIAFFAMLSLLALIFVRPLVVKVFLKKGKGVQTNADALVGKICQVSETVDPVEGKGRVTIDGDSWKAVSADGGVIEKGSRVEVVSVNSIILTVKSIES